ncbi:MAG: beta-propeller domain-containing protein [Clostridia bacterium]|nr:beta-propeller domain-containing protein [Clostridia bacterium]
MKKNKLLTAMSLIDEKYVDEAHPERLKRKKQSIMRLGALAACLCVLITSLSLFMFIPFSTELPDVSEYEGSEYYPIIEKLNVATFAPPVYKNNFQRIFYRLSDMLGAKAEDGDDAPTDTGIEGISTYREVTDNQVEGVIEGDLFKASGEYIFYLRKDTLSAYSIKGDASEKVGEYKIEITLDKKYSYSYHNNWEMYLSADGKTVTVIAPYGAKMENGGRIAIILLDVSNPAEITEKKQIILSGGYLSSRTVGGDMLLISNFRVGSNPDFSKEENYLPQYNTGEGFVSIPASDIISPEKLSSSLYTVIWRFDGASALLTDYTAYLSYSNEVYVSPDNVYVSRQYQNKTAENGVSVSEIVTEIAGVGYSENEFKHLGTATVKGYLKDQYSLDEHNGILRAALTTQISKYKDKESGKATAEDIDTSVSLGVTTSASLYCIDLNTWQTVAAVENFAPVGETVRSVRFDGDSAYVCTAVQSTDPVFFFDLSDTDNITYTDTGTIEGFSTSLIQLGNGYLLGIGQGASADTVKLEVYKESEGGVVSVCKKEYGTAYYSQVYKSYFIDRENDLIGLGITYSLKSAQPSDETGRYVLLHFDGYALNELCNVSLDGSDDTKRAVCIDGYLYMFGDIGFKVQKIQ